VELDLDITKNSLDKIIGIAEEAKRGICGGGDRMQKVLLVEDEEIERVFLKNLFQKQIKDYQVIGEACNGREAIALAKNYSPDVIFMDVKMPGIDGLEATQVIKKMRPQAHIIILTAYEEFKFAQEALRAGAEEYLLKPAQPEEIMKVLKNIYQRSVRADFTNDITGLDGKLEIINYDKEKVLMKALQNNDVRLLVSTLEDYLNDLLQLPHLPAVLKIRLFEFITVLTRNLCDAGFNPHKAHELKMKFYESISRLETFSDAQNCIALIKDELVSASQANDTSKKEVVKSVLHYIKANLSKDLSLDSISERFHFSSSHLSRLMKRETGFTYPEYLNRLRLAEAKTLLRNSELNIHTIALEVGYREVSHFNRVFKKAIGISPTKYRVIFFNEQTGGSPHLNASSKQVRKGKECLYRVYTD